MKRRDLLLAVLAVLIVWQFAAVIVQRPILPSPAAVILTFFQELQAGLLVHALASIWRVAAGILLALLTAVPAGLVLGSLPRVDRIFGPVIYLLYPVPKVVLVPVLLLFVGVGDAAKILIIALILFFQVVVLVRDQVAALPPEVFQSLRSLGAGRRALFRFVYLPASLPAILTAVRQSIGTAVAVLYIAELFATRWGLGYYIFLNGSTLLNYRAMYAGVLAMSLLGLSLYFAVDWLERQLCPWKFMEKEGALPRKER